MLSNKLIVVTGANKGIGFALVEKLLLHNDKPKVILTSRSSQLGEKALQNLINKHPEGKERLEYQELDIDSTSSIADFCRWMHDSHQNFDILVNNAAIGEVKDIMSMKDYVMPPELVKKTIKTDFYSTVYVTEALLPYLSESGKVVNQSATMARFNKQGILKDFFNSADLTREKLFDKMREFEEKAMNNQHVEAGYNKGIYNVAKGFLNAYTKTVLPQYLKAGQTCFATYPGWCKTDMGKEKAPMTAEQGTVSAMTAMEFSTEDSKKNNGTLLDEKGKVIPY